MRMTVLWSAAFRRRPFAEMCPAGNKQLRKNACCGIFISVPDIPFGARRCGGTGRRLRLKIVWVTPVSVRIRPAAPTDRTTFPDRKAVLFFAVIFGVSRACRSRRRGERSTLKNRGKYPPILTADGVGGIVFSTIFFGWVLTQPAVMPRKRTSPTAPSADTVRFRNRL